MIKTYWKQLLVTAYIAVVLILSATAKAESFRPTEAADDLNDLQNRIELLYGNHTEPAVFSQPTFQAEGHKPLVMPIEDTGKFIYENATAKLVFISDITGQIFYVRCDNTVRADITSNEIFNIKGFSFSPSSNQLEVRSPSQQQVSFLSNNNIIFVTGVEIQR